MGDRGSGTMRTWTRKAAARAGRRLAFVPLLAAALALPAHAADPLIPLSGVYDIRITNQRDELIAVFRGRSYRMKGRPVVADLPLPG